MTYLHINGVDYTSMIQQTVDITENVRKVYGPNGDITIDGVEHPDLLAVKIDPSFRLKPLSRADYNTMANLMSQATVTLEYTSFKSFGLRTITAMPDEMTATYATDAWNGRIYTGNVISFREV